MPDLLGHLKSALADRYAIVREVGRGGMAVVYLAEDLKHGRQVALKVFQPSLSATLGTERFLHEIEIVARLQHPHILPLYDSGDADGFLYFVMPFAEGESLRQRLDREKQLAVDESVRIAVEVADGLDYAHRKGVVHRDIKPANILLAEGHATIADFGIARAIEAARADRFTSTGLGVGTPLYASPEQATAQETLDGRTDIYSLGCVLYEMLGGEPPHTGATPQIIQSRRLSETPTTLHTLRDTVPPILDHVIARALARIPADRYATASQFGQALQAALFAATPAVTADVAATPGALATTPAAVDLEHKRGAPRWALFALSALALSIVIAGATLLLSSSRRGRAPLQITVSNIVHVTSDPGIEFQPAISPDGSEVAYVVGPIEAPRLVVRSTIDIGSGGGTRPGEELAAGHWLPAWTPDGASIRLWACPEGAEFRFEADCNWREVGTHSGSVRTVTVPRESERGDQSRHSWSPDGTRVAFVVRDSIFATSRDKAEPELLGALGALGVFADMHSLAWSPDGRWIAYATGNSQWRYTANVLKASLWILDANGGQPVRVTDDTTMNVSPQWLPDSRHILFVSDRDGPRGIYVVEVGPEGPRGPPQSVLGSSDPHSISISADGGKLAYAKFTVAQNIWSIPIPRAGVVSIRDAVPVTTGNQVIEKPAVSRDGEWIVFESDRGGEFDIYKMWLDGGAEQLVADIPGIEFAPDLSPDGTEIAYHTPESGAFVSADGGTPEPLADFFGVWPDWSPDGLAIAFNSRGPEGAGPFSIWIASRDSVGMPWSAPSQLTDFACGVPDWAPDGASLVCIGRGEILRVSRSGGVLSGYDPSTVDLARFYPAEFSPDGSRIYFVGTDEEGAQGVWWIPTSGGTETKIITFDDPLLSVVGFAVGREHVYLTISEQESDIWVMDLDW